ncbi:MAG: hypothetical protein R3C02_20645 [Planctomycetaceae bacterium]
MLMMTGRIWVVISPFVLMLAGFLLGPLINLALPNIAVDEDKIAEYMMSTLVVLTILATFVAYVFSIRRKIVDSRMIWWGGLASIVTLAVVYIPIAYIVGWNKFSSDWLNDWQVLLSLGLMSLAAAPLAMAPLAIAWNRHR